jgi:hypothetical protein
MYAYCIEMYIYCMYSTYILYRPTCPFRFSGKFVCCLFSWRYNPLWLYFHSPVVGFSLLVFEVS